MAKKIIQICATAGGTDNAVDTIYALTDTGEVFRLRDATQDANTWESVTLAIEDGRTFLTD